MGCLTIAVRYYKFTAESVLKEFLKQLNISTKLRGDTD